jgi:protein TonB
MNKALLSKLVLSPKTLRPALFILAALAHGALIMFLAFRTPAAPPLTEEPLRVMKLADLVEAPPPPPPPPPPPEEKVPENAVESIAENFIETEEVPEEAVVPPATILTAPPAQTEPAATEEVYLRPHQISDSPRFNEADIIKNLVYPPIALRSGIKGTVILELFISREGTVQRITVLKEDPPGRGFAEAAVRAFEGLSCVPARANGRNVSARIRYPVTFRPRE